MAAQKSASFGGVSLFVWRPFPRPGLTFLGRRAQPRSRMAAGHRGAARSVLDGGEHGGNLARGKADLSVLETRVVGRGWVRHVGSRRISAVPAPWL